MKKFIIEFENEEKTKELENEITQMTNDDEFEIRLSDYNFYDFEFKLRKLNSDIFLIYDLTENFTYNDIVKEIVSKNQLFELIEKQYYTGDEKIDDIKLSMIDKLDNEFIINYFKD